MKNPVRYTIGIDEVGRGPLAGPVTVCAVLLPDNFDIASVLKAKKLVLRDSKKLSALQRGRWVSFIETEPEIRYTMHSIAPAGIDRMNITAAANHAAGKAVEKLYKQTPKHVRQAQICLDGGLHIPGNLLIKMKHGGACQTIIRGDETVPAISIASILAKVARDAYMEKLGKRYPAYGFGSHKGYGTRAHIAAIRKWGRTPHHRKTFIKNFI